MNTLSKSRTKTSIFSVQTMSSDRSETPTKRVVDYNAWNSSGSENAASFVLPSLNFAEETQYGDTARIKIPRSPRPLPAEAPVLHGADGLLSPPPINTPKGVELLLFCFVIFFTVCSFSIE